MAGREYSFPGDDLSEVTEVDLPAEVVSIDRGVPVKRKARIRGFAEQKALLEIERELKKGETVALIINRVDRAFYDLFNLDEPPASTMVSVKTQGKVLEVKNTDKPGYFIALITYQGNMRIMN